MSQGLDLNTSIAKEHAVLPKPVGRPNPQVEAASTQSQKLGEVRDSGVQWERVEGRNDEKDEPRISSGQEDQVVLSTSTVITPNAVSAPTQVSNLRESLKQKFVQLFEQSYANIFHHNRLVAKVAEWTVGNILERLALLGMSPQELAEIRDRVRENLIAQNYAALRQVAYDETMLEIVA